MEFSTNTACCASPLLSIAAALAVRVSGSGSDYCCAFGLRAGSLAVAQAKRAIDGGLSLPLPEALAHERACYEIVLESEDRNEGLAAFVEKRPPKFTGK